MSWAAIIVGAGTLAYKAYTGAKQKKEGKALMNQAYPQYTIPSEITNNANQGLPSEQYSQAMKNIDRNKAYALSGAQDRRSGLGMIARTQQSANDATLNLDVENAKARMKNQQTLAGYKDKQWQLNTQGKYNRDYNYGAQLTGAGNQNISSGVDDLISGVGSAAYRGAFNKTGSYNPYANDPAWGNPSGMQRMAYNPQLISYRN